ncbi:MAG: hypothetical protein M3P83_03305, partial [Actinomycetota bacterium]|nr:hypothetical protein [Actinomycetota bacterium]
MCSSNGSPWEALREAVAAVSAIDAAQVPAAEAVERLPRLRQLIDALHATSVRLTGRVDAAK